MLILLIANMCTTVEMMLYNIPEANKKFCFCLILLLACACISVSMLIVSRLLPAVCYRVLNLGQCPIFTGWSLHDKYIAISLVYNLRRAYLTALFTCTVGLQKNKMANRYDHRLESPPPYQSNICCTDKFLSLVNVYKVQK